MRSLFNGVGEELAILDSRVVPVQRVGGCVGGLLTQVGVRASGWLHTVGVLVQLGAFSCSRWLCWHSRSSCIKSVVALSTRVVV